MSSVAATVKNVIYDKINNLSTVQCAYKHEELQPSGFPSVSIVATGLKGEFWTTAENQRTYAYRVFVHYDIGQDLQNVAGDRMDLAEDVVTDVIDEIIRVIDDGYTLDDSLGVSILYAEAVDADYQYTELAGGWAKTAIATIVVHTDYVIQSTI